MQRELDLLRARVALLEGVVAEAYQFAGAVGAPVRVLDNLDAAVSGRRLPHETFLPVRSEECDEVADLLHLLEKVAVAPERTAGLRAPAKANPRTREKVAARRNTLAAVLGRSGGQARTRAKAAAARANGAKGGRPRKTA